MEIKREIGEAIGEGSMCWDPIPTGVFDATRASAIVERVCKSIFKIRNEGNGLRELNAAAAVKVQRLQTANAELEGMLYKKDLQVKKLVGFLGESLKIIDEIKEIINLPEEKP